MNCSDIIHLLPLYLSGELDASRSAALREHMSACSACASDLEWQRELDKHLRSCVLAEEINSAPLDGRVRQCIANEVSPGAKRKPRRVISGPWALGLAALVAAFLLIASLVGYHDFFHSAMPDVYAAAAQDHRREVVERERRTWFLSRVQIEALAEAQGFPKSVVSVIPSTNYRLERGKLCRLDGSVYLHLVYTDGAEEFSVFWGLRDRERLTGSSNESVDGRLVYTIDLEQEHLAGFQTDKLNAFVIADESRSAALQLARFAATSM